MMDFEDFDPSPAAEEGFADSFFGVDKENDPSEQGDGESDGGRLSLLSNFVTQLSKKAHDRRLSLRPRPPWSPAKSSPRKAAKRPKRQMSNESLKSVTSVEQGNSPVVLHAARKRKALDRVPSIAAMSSRRIQPLGVDESPYKKAKVAVKEYKPPSPIKVRPKEQRLWSNTVRSDQANLDLACVRRQEAIYEIYVHAQSMMSDAKTVLENYEKPMASLGLVSKEERKILFGNLYTLPEVHQAITEQISEQRDSVTGRTELIGATLLKALPALEPLVTFCSELQTARDVYERKLQVQRVKDFLERCRTSAFSNRRSLWDLLDSQRSSLLKYPLLLRQLIKVTPEDHDDLVEVHSALRVVEEMVSEMDRRAGDVKCRQVLSRLQYPNNKRCPIVDTSRQLLYSGPLKLAVRNVQVEVMLFDRALVVARKHNRPTASPLYQVIYNPHYTSAMRLEDNRGIVKDSAANNSFRTLRSGASAESGTTFGIERTCAVRTIYAKERSSLMFAADNHHDAKSWIHEISEAIIASFDSSTPPLPESSDKKLSRSGSTSAISTMSCGQLDSGASFSRNSKCRRSIR